MRHLLAARPRELWIQLLAARYHEFHPDDVVPLCIMCHNEMHQRYLPYIQRITFLTGRRVSWFTETETRQYIAHLRTFCKRVLTDGFVVRKEIVTDYYAGKILSNSRGAN